MSISIRHAVARVLGASLLLCAALAVGELLRAGVSPLTQPLDIGRLVVEPTLHSDPVWSPWDLAPEEEAGPLDRVVGVRISPEQLELHFRLRVPEEHPYRSHLVGGLSRPAELVERVFGEVRLGNSRVDRSEFFETSQVLDPESGELALDIGLRRDLAAGAYVHLRILEPEKPVYANVADRAEIEVEGRRLDVIGPAESIEQLNKPETGAQTALLSFREARGEDLALLAAPRRGSRMSFGPLLGLFQRMPSALRVPVLSRLWFGAMSLLPFVIAIFLIAGASELGAAERDVWARAGWSLLGFQLVVYLSSAILWQQSSVPWMWSLRETVDRALAPYSAWASLGHRRDLLGGVTAALLVVWVPMLLGHDAEPSPGRKRRWIFRFRTVVAAMLAVALGAVSLLQDRIYGWMLLWVGACFLAIWCLADALHWTYTRRAPYAAGIAVAAASVGIAVLDPVSVQLGRERADLVHFLLTALLGARLLYALLDSLWRWALRSQQGSGRAPATWTRRALAVLSLLAAMPMSHLVSQDWPPAFETSVLVFANTISRFLPHGWVAGVVWLLWRYGRSSLEISPLLRSLGILGAATLLFDPRSSLLPLTFLLGWWVFARWLVLPASAWSRIQPFVDPVVSRRAQLVDRILDMRAIDEAHAAFRKEQQQKFAGNEIDADAYAQALAKRRAEVKRLRDSFRIRDKAPREVALSFGPEGTAWSNGVHGATFAGLFALPWILLSLSQLVQAPLAGGSYPLLDFLNDCSLVVAKWLLFGFFLGYFFPYIRGRNGLEKAFCLFIAVIAPTLPFALLAGEATDSWNAPLFWGAQVLLHCVLLGTFAFDYAVMRRGGYRNWRAVFDLHGLPSVGASVSSILVAVGATITTFFNDRLADLVKALLNTVLPAAGAGPPPGAGP